MNKATIKVLRHIFGQYLKGNTQLANMLVKINSPEHRAAMKLEAETRIVRVCPSSRNPDYEVWVRPAS